MKRFYKVRIQLGEENCPNLNIAYDSIDCNACEFCKYIGTLGGEYYIDCAYDELDTTTEE